ncbi:hypothetical protein RDWZM_010562 [Blomia tropicalis]|uniref:Uncharacterized protein n=1 Tax=Blomia tropicalis TaxID=40697 RepID=A0A9Q0M281_BLOTA|nr:hypothetical protein RDWZM_010562 [Blomia tropicalis]
MSNWQNEMMKKMEKETEVTRLGTILQAKLFVVEEQLHRFLKQMKRHVITDDFDLLFPGITLKGDSDINHWHADGCEIKKKGEDISTLVLKITVPKIDQERSILQADPFIIFHEAQTNGQSTNGTKEVCEYHYEGPSYVMFDTKTKCTRELDTNPITPTQTFQVYRPDQCMIWNTSADPIWKKGKCHPNDNFLELRVVQIKEDESNRYIYCWKQKLSTKSKEFTCENAVYKSNKTLPFSINNNPSPIYNTDKITDTIALGRSVTNAVNENLFTINSFNETFRHLDELIVEEQNMINTLPNRDTILMEEKNLWMLLIGILFVVIACVVTLFTWRCIQTRAERTTSEEPTRKNKTKQQQNHPSCIPLLELPRRPTSILHRPMASISDECEL